MSLNIFENTNLDFDVSIIKTSRVLNSDNVVTEVVESVTPLEPAAVLDLSVRESTLNMGFIGTITVSNKFKILDKLNISTNSPNDVYVAIKITDLELQNIDIEDTNKVITLLGYINNTASASQNAIDGAVVFSFEEAFIAALRQTQTVIFTGKTSENGEAIYNQDSTDYTVTELLNAFNERIFKLKDTDPIVLKNSKEPNVRIDVQSAIDEDKEIVSSVYDTVYEMLQKTGVGNQNTGTTLTAQPTYLRLVNAISDQGSNDNIVRQIKFDTFITPRHHEFIGAVIGKQINENDFSDVYLEKFILGPLTDNLANDPNTSLYNKIETYDITRANIGELRDRVWGDYRLDKTIPGQNKSIHSPNTIKLFDIMKSFIDLNFSNLPIDFNLPILDPKVLKEFHIPFSGSNEKEVNRTLVQQLNKIINKVHKSFLTINETITFTVKGNVIRQPNKFIWLEDGKEEADYKKLWYVNSVEHKFSSGRYTNTIIATKIFGDTPYNVLMANELQNSKRTPNLIANNIPRNLA